MSIYIYIYIYKLYIYLPFLVEDLIDWVQYLVMSDSSMSNDILSDHRTVQMIAVHNIYDYQLILVAQTIVIFTVVFLEFINYVH